MVKSKREQASEGLLNSAFDHAAREHDPILVSYYLGRAIVYALFEIANAIRGKE